MVCAFYAAIICTAILRRPFTNYRYNLQYKQSEDTPYGCC